MLCRQLVSHATSVIYVEFALEQGSAMLDSVIELFNTPSLEWSVQNRTL